MLEYILYELSLFAPGDSDKEARRDLDWFLQALTARNQDYLMQHPGTPTLYKSGVRYVRPAQFLGECRESRVLREALGSKANRGEVAEVLALVGSVFGGERFRDIGRILDNGGGDCDNLACWRAAELRQAGIPARPALIWRERPDGGTTYHVIVLHPDKTVEDPSLLLGMGGEARVADRAEEIRKNEERVANARGGNGTRVRAPITPDFDLDALVEQVVGGRGGSRHGGHRGHHGHRGGGWGPWPHGNVVFWPGVYDPYYEDEDIDLDEILSRAPRAKVRYL